MDMKSLQGQFSPVVDRLIARLEAGELPPWRCDWRRDPRFVATRGRHVNLVSGKPYNGGNQFWLAIQSRTTPFWLTEAQAKKLGGRVEFKELKNPAIILQCFSGKRKDADEAADDGARPGEICLNRRPIFGLRVVRVWNLDQCCGVRVPTKFEVKDEDEDGEKVLAPITAARKLIDGWKDKPRTTYGGDRAYYRPSTDEVRLPKFSDFKSAEGFYGTMFHEYVHATAHSSRLARSNGAGFAYFGSPIYAQEELVAEIGAALLCDKTGISNVTLENSAAYVKGWLKALKNDKNMLLTAARDAEKAAGYITRGGKQ